MMKGFVIVVLLSLFLTWVIIIPSFQIQSLLAFINAPLCNPQTLNTTNTTNATNTTNTTSAPKLQPCH
jgi:hypothetical protein